MIYTSYYAYVKKYMIPKDKCVSITLGGKFWEEDICVELMPTGKILSWWKSLTKEEQKDKKNQLIYERLFYRDVLSKRNAKELYKELDGKILLCFEKTGDFCHRHIVAKWFNENGFVAKEFDFKEDTNIWGM